MKSKLKIKTWFKRVGLAGFLFFLIKGLIWLFIFYGLGTGIKGCSGAESSVEDSHKVIGERR